MQDAAEFIDQWQESVERMKKAHPDAVKGFGALFQGTMKEGALPVKQKELIALAIAVTQRCEPCILLHVDKCLMAGATPAEIIEAAGVSVMMQGGPGFTHLPVVLNALDALAEKTE